MTRSVATNGAVTLAQYDDAGRVTQLTDVRNQVYRFQYAGFTEPTLVVHPMAASGRRFKTNWDALAFTDETGSPRSIQPGRCWKSTRDHRTRWDSVGNGV